VIVALVSFSVLITDTLIASTAQPASRSALLSPPLVPSSPDSPPNTSLLCPQHRKTHRDRTQRHLRVCVHTHTAPQDTHPGRDTGALAAVVFTPCSERRAHRRGCASRSGDQCVQSCVLTADLIFLPFWRWLSHTTLKMIWANY